MSIELIVNPDEDGESEGFDLAPNHAWRAFSAWVETLDEKYDQLRSLAIEGVAGDGRRTADELEEVLERDDLDGDVAAVGGRLLELIEDLESVDVLVISSE